MGILVNLAIAAIATLPLLTFVGEAHALSYKEVRYESENEPFHQCGRAGPRAWVSAANETNCFVVFGPYDTAFRARGTGALLALFSLAGSADADVIVDVVDITRNKVFVTKTVRGLNSTFQLIPVIVRNFDGAGMLELRVFKRSGEVRVNWTQSSYLHPRANVKTRQGNVGTDLESTLNVKGSIYVQAKAPNGQIPCLRLVERSNRLFQDTVRPDPSDIEARHPNPEADRNGGYCSRRIVRVAVRSTDVDYRLRALDLEPQDNTIFLTLNDFRVSFDTDDVSDLLEGIEQITDPERIRQELEKLGL